MDLKRITLSAIERELMESPICAGVAKIEIANLAIDILNAIEASDLEIEQRFSEMNLNYQQEEKPE